MIVMSDLLETSVSAAIAAGKRLRDLYLEPRVVSTKGFRDIVTDADYSSQGTIALHLARQFPDYGVLAEETAPQRVRTVFERPTWIVDPLDGTSNYARQIPFFSVSISLIHGKDILLGVVHDPIRRETFFAQKGKGAFLLDCYDSVVPIRVSQVMELKDAILGVDWARDSSNRRKTAKWICSVSAQCRTTRNIGSSALALAYVAAGRIDGYYHLALKLWDMAAGVILIEESGGTVTEPGGEQWELGDGPILASNSNLHAVLIAI